MPQVDRGHRQTSRVRREVFVSNRRKRLVNLLYLDVITLLHGVAALLPAPLRNLYMRRVLSRSAREVFFDRRVYVKFPWLVSIGPGTSVNRGVEFYPDFLSKSDIRVGSRCYIAPHVRFLASGHDVDDLVKHVGGPIRVGDDVWIGAGATILPGVSIGDRAIVGAGAVVVASVEADVRVGGVPARPLANR